MPRIYVTNKEVPDWEYPDSLAELMKQFEELVEAFRADAAKSGRNLVACRRARTHLQKLRNMIGPELRLALFAERDRLEALRHGMTVDEWNAFREH